MTQTFDELVDPENQNTKVKNYPTKWDDLQDGVDYRELDEHRFEVRSATHTLVLDKIGLSLFEDDSLQGHVLFVDWCSRNSVTPTPREDIEDGRS